MTTAQVVETSVTVANSSFQNYTHLDDHTRQTTDTPGFKPFTMIFFIWTDSFQLLKQIFQTLDVLIMYLNSSSWQEAAPFQRYDVTVQ